MSALLMRRVILQVSGNPRVERLVRTNAGKFGIGRFVAGETLAEAVAVAGRLQANGLLVTMDRLGEYVNDLSQAREAVQEILALADALHAAGSPVNISVKLTQLGLDIGREHAAAHLRSIVERAAGYDGFIRVDMEDSARVDVTLDLVKELWQEFPGRIGTVIQSYLYRSRDDLEGLAALGMNVRIVKGAYLEPPDRAFPDKEDVDRNYFELVRLLLERDCYAAAATHDAPLIQQILDFARQEGIGRDRFEFQMLYGIRPDLQEELARDGYRVRVYVPYGRDWYGYFSRRLAERPANVWFVLRNLFR